MEELSKRLKQVRKELKLSQIELADKIDVQQADVSRWESGKQTPSFQTLQKYSSIKVNVSWLFTGVGKIFEDIVDGTTYMERRIFLRKTNGSDYELFAVEEHVDGNIYRREPLPWEEQLNDLAYHISDLENTIASKTEGLVSRQA